LFILGATGKTGTQLLDLSLARGHSVTAFVRSPQKITRSEPALAVIGGDPRKAPSLAEAMRGHDAVLSALGPRPTEALTGSTLLRETAATTLEAMQSAAVERLVIVSSAMLYPSRQIPYVLSRWILAPHCRDLRAMEAIVCGSPAQWTVVRPPRLLERRDERYEVASDGQPPAHAVLSWRALAAFMIESAESGRYRRSVVGICR
jgi:putative NADH-flavin reductase